MLAWYCNHRGIMQGQRGEDGCGGKEMVRRGSEGEEGAESEEGCGGRLPTASKFGTSLEVRILGSLLFFAHFFLPKKNKNH